LARVHNAWFAADSTLHLQCQDGIVLVISVVRTKAKQTVFFWDGWFCFRMYAKYSVGFFSFWCFLQRDRRLQFSTGAGTKTVIADDMVKYLVHCMVPMMRDGNIQGAVGFAISR
jgi:hypothetical protein